MGVEGEVVNWTEDVFDGCLAKKKKNIRQHNESVLVVIATPHPF